MKLNNGRGYDYKSYSSQPHLHNQHQSSSGRDAHANNYRNSHRPVTTDRLNAAQPPPPSPAKGGAGKTRDRPSAPGGVPPKRQSGGLEASTPAASTQAHFQNSNTHLPSRIGSPGNPGVTNQPVGGMQGNNDPQPTFVQKVMKALCCGR